MIKKNKYAIRIIIVSIICAILFFFLSFIIQATINGGVYSDMTIFSSVFISAILSLFVYIVMRISNKKIQISKNKSTHSSQDITEEYKICPSCAEKIKKEAIKCRHCGKSFQNIFTKDLSFLSIVVVCILIATFLGFFHIVPKAPGIPIVPKAHFTYSMTFITINDFIEIWNNRNLGQAVRGDDLLDNLERQFINKGWVLKNNEKTEIDPSW